MSSKVTLRRKRGVAREAPAHLSADLVHHDVDPVGEGDPRACKLGGSEGCGGRRDVLLGDVGRRVLGVEGRERVSAAVDEVALVLLEVVFVVLPFSL